MPEDDEHAGFDAADDFDEQDFPPSFGETARGRHAARRGLLLAATALVAAGFTFGAVDVATHDVSGNPAAIVTPSASSPATMQLEIGGPVTAVSATSITIGSGERAITAAVTSATKITGKATSIGGIKVGDVVSASLGGTAGKLVAASIQDPASLPSGPGQ